MSPTGDLLVRVWLRACMGESPSCAREAVALGATVAVVWGDGASQFVDSHFGWP